MDMPVEAWRQAALKRHSRRAFASRKAEPQSLDRIEAVCTSSDRSLLDTSGATRVVLVRDLKDDIFRGMVGGFFKCDKTAQLLDLQPNEQIVAVSP